MLKQRAQQVKQLKKAGWMFILLALVFSLSAFFTPLDDSRYWLSKTGKEGTYWISGLLFFFGLYCWGAIWRRESGT